MARFTRTTLFAAGAAALAALLVQAHAVAQADEATSDASAFLSADPPPATIKGRFKLVTIGELLYSHPMANSPDPAFQAVAKLVRDGDVAIAEQEGPFLDLAHFTGVPGNGGLIGDPDKAQDEKAMGISMVALANNHTTDWGWDGLKEMQRLLDDAGVAHAGSGRDLSDALKPGIQATPHGRIAMVSTASTFRPLANATDAFGDAPARPGISVLRLRRIDLVLPDQFAALRAVAIQSTRFSHHPPRADATEISLGGAAYRAGAAPGVLWEMNAYDHAGLMRAVQSAKRQSDYVIFTIHAHESPTGMDDDNPQAAPFLTKLSHDAVDAGADFVYGHGQHSLRGIEIYKGRPIFYGVGAYFLSGDIKVMSDSATDEYEGDNQPAPPKPSAHREVTANPGGVNPPVWYDGIVATTEYDGPVLKTIHIYPLDLGDTFDKARRGIPHVADAANAERILKKLQTISAPFGTRIEIEGSVGVIRVN
ncbi:MAG TPA: CapA family protein [Caulobacteraceae bacterium]|jgi:poly-gamma-glutamate synthesis protein (capsule biosynthesis protein)|nr:CapA family protein [Caulobacteraceae bacterium]